MKISTQRYTSTVVSTPAQSQVRHQVIVRLRLIGQMEAWTVSSASVLPVGRKTRALLAILALSAPRPVLRGRLADMLWSDRGEGQARTSLRQEIHRLRDALGEVADQIISINRDHLMLRPGTVWLDVEEILRANPGKPAALGLLDGKLLEDLDGIDPAFDSWLAAERERLRDRARVLAELMLRDQSDPDLTIPVAQQLLSIDRAHEGGWRALMKAYNSRGERAMAIQAYERCRSVLADLLNAQPSEETQRLAASIRTACLNKSASDLQSSSFPKISEDVRENTYISGITDSRNIHRDNKSDENVESTLRQSIYIGDSSSVRIGILPAKISGMPDGLTHIATGLAEEIAALLSRNTWISVKLSSELAPAEGQTIDESTFNRLSNVDLLLEGSIQRESMRLRISMRLLDLRAGNQLVWQGRFDRNLQDALTLQDDVAAELVAQLEPQVVYLEAARANGCPSEEENAPELTLRARALLTRIDHAAAMKADGLLRDAMQIDPKYSASHSWAAYLTVFMLRQGWARDPDVSRCEALRLAERGIALDPQDARAFSIAGYVRALVERRPREALMLHHRALVMNPSLAIAWMFAADAYLYVGELAEAQRHVSRALQLAPMDPHRYLSAATQTTIHLFCHDHEAALCAGREVPMLYANCTTCDQASLSALGHLGRREEADIVLGRLLGLQPEFTISSFINASPFTVGEYTSHFVEGLRLAGAPG